MSFGIIGRPFLRRISSFLCNSSAVNSKIFSISSLSILNARRNITLSYIEHRQECHIFLQYVWKGFTARLFRSFGFLTQGNNFTGRFKITLVASYLRPQKKLSEQHKRTFAYEKNLPRISIAVYNLIFPCFLFHECPPSKTIYDIENHSRHPGNG